MKEIIETFNCEILAHASLLTTLGPLRLSFIRIDGHALAQQRITSYENLRKWLDEWFTTKEQDIF